MSELSDLRNDVRRVFDKLDGTANTLGGKIDLLAGDLALFKGEIKATCPVHAQAIAELKARTNGISNRLWAFIVGFVLALITAVAKLWGGRP